ncbi:ESPR domain-containing protein [Budvicia aquatica]|uniref:ESPR domain-containing protein n=1 Tax=Budvicia aquatica TaxID=82979 RepID=UPI00141B3A75|nr:ESPR-type extended signal peptide-containing protein [Budvicia aquatica]
MNKIYRIIWNNALGVWVVTSELGRGKIKSATSKALAAVALTTVMSTSVLASDCSSSTFICNLDSAWSFSNNNRGVGSVTISDGQTYHVNGPKTYASANGSSIGYSTINQLINGGYINAPLLPADEIQMVLGQRAKILRLSILLLMRLRSLQFITLAECRSLKAAIKMVVMQSLDSGL